MSKPEGQKRVGIYLSEDEYLALRRRISGCDRTISQHVRHLIRHDLEDSVVEALDREKRRGGGNEGEGAA